MQCEIQIFINGKNYVELKIVPEKMYIRVPRNLFSRILLHFLHTCHNRKRSITNYKRLRNGTSTNRTMKLEVTIELT